MSETKMVITPPKALHAATVHDETQRFTLDLGDGRRLFWCPINRVGSIQAQASGQWVSEGPLEFMEFLSAISAVGIEAVEDQAAAERWIEACLINEAAAHLLRATGDKGGLPDCDARSTASNDGPQAPEHTTLRDPRYTILDDTGTRLVTWCPCSRAGGVYHAEVQIWATVWPVTFGDFLRWLETRSVAMDHSEDLTHWIEACTQLPPGTPTAPGGRC